MVKLVMRIISAGVLGLVLCLWIVQNSSSVKNLVSSKIIAAVAQQWHANITAESCDINFFTCSLYINNARIEPTDDKKYVWGFAQGRVYISPFNLLLKKEVSLWITFNNAWGQTCYSKGKVDLLDHIQAIFTQQPSGFSIRTKSLAINNGALKINVEHDTSKKITASSDKPATYSMHLPGSFIIENITHPTHKDITWRSALRLTQATIAHNDTVIAHTIEHTTSLYMNKTTNLWHGTMATSVMSGLLDPQETYMIEGTWEEHEKKVTVRDSHQTLDIHGALTGQQSYVLHGTMPAAIIAQAACFLSSGAALDQSVKGQCSFDLTALHNANACTLEGSIEASDLSYGSISLQKLLVSVKPGNDDHLHATITALHEPGYHFTGTGTYDMAEKKGSLSLSNSVPVLFPFMGGSVEHKSWMLERNALNVRVGIEHDGSLIGSYTAQASHHITQKKRSYSGTLSVSDNKLHLRGTTNNGTYAINVALSPSLHITDAHYHLGTKELIALYASESNEFLLQGPVRWSFIRSFLDPELRRFIFNNNCVFAVSIDQTNLDSVHVSAQLDQGSFFIPDFHNLINTARAELTINPSEKKAMLTEVLLELSKGSIRCPQAIVTFNDDASVKFLHAPLSINNMFVNWKHDFLGFTSGNLLINKTSHGPINVTGALVLKRSMLKDTFFAHEPSVAFDGTGGAIPPISLPIGFDIKVFTQKPLKAKTQSLETNAMLDLTFKHTPCKEFATAPLVKGTIDVQGGAVKFFHNKLHIEFGKIQFINGTTNDPLVELYAKNRIGKYLVQLQVTGSLQKPTILLESSPDLTEEQIIGLLLTGSENTTLQADLPSMILQNLDSFIFGSKRNGRAAWFDKISKTFKYIQITPDLTNETNPTKLVGSISVNLNDQLRAHIQKSFDLEKDFSAQLEYALSDDINLKVIRDQRGELGSEVEMRFKLG